LLLKKKGSDERTSICLLRKRGREHHLKQPSFREQRGKEKNQHDIPKLIPQRRKRDPLTFLHDQPHQPGEGRKKEGETPISIIRGGRGGGKEGSFLKPDVP